MGGVDLFDQCRAAYTTDQARSAKWTTKVFFFCLDVAVVNSYVLARTSDGAAPQSRRKSGNTRVVERRQFQRRLAIGLIALGLGKDTDALIAELEGTGPVSNHGKNPCLPGHVDGGARPRCAQCKTAQTRWRCETCDVALCLTADSTCFRDHVEQV